MGVVRKILGYFDVFTTGILIALLLGIIVPCHGQGAVFFDWLTNAAIVLLFFLYGVKLSRRSVVEGLLNWRLQSMVFAFTFVFFPVVIPLLRPVFEPLVGGALFMGLVYGKTRKPLVIPRTMCDIELNAPTVVQLLTKGKTELIKGFTSHKSGKQFDAYLVFNASTGRVSYEFPPRK